MCITSRAAVSVGLAFMLAQMLHAQPIAGQFLQSAGVRQGLVVHAACGDGSLTVGLHSAGKNVVHGLADNASDVAAARATVAAAGVYGPVSVEQVADFDALPYADDMVTLLVAQTYGTLASGGLGIAEVVRVLSPYGTAFLGQTDQATVQNELAAAGISGAAVSTESGLVKLGKPYPSGMDEWAQHRHDASGTMLSRDQVIAPINSARWIAGPLWADRPSPMSEGEQIFSAGGRVFYMSGTYVTTTSGILPSVEARDAFNGRFLWRARVAASWFCAPNGLATGGQVYVPQSTGPYVALDAATGVPSDTLGFRADTSRNGGGSVAYVNGTFLASRGQQAWDAATGTKRWDLPVTFPAPSAVPATGTGYREFAVGGGRIYYNASTDLLCRDLATGQQLWSNPRQVAEWIHFYADERVFTWTAGDSGRYTLTAYAASSGAQQWQYAFVTQLATYAVGMGKFTPAIYQVGDTVWVNEARSILGQAQAVFVALDCATGAELGTVAANYVEKRCHPNIASPGQVWGTYGDSRNWRTAAVHRPYLARGACVYGNIIANGLLYQDLGKCLCAQPLRGRAGFAAVPSPAYAESAPASSRVEQGPASSLALGDTATAADWPQFRADRLRSSCASSTVPLNVVRAWERVLVGTPTPPVVARGRVFVATPDQHAVYALDAFSGAVLWQYRAGGRVDSPPTYWKGRVLFGANDGWVYCLAAGDGALVWRFQAAPQDRRILVREQIESLWPVAGSVLVDNDTAYVSAGRHSDADGGIHVHALRALDGTPLWHTVVDSGNPFVSHALDGGRGGRGHIKNDVLLCDSAYLYVDNMELSKSTGVVLPLAANVHLNLSAPWGGPIGYLCEAPGRLGQLGGQDGLRVLWRYKGYGGHGLAFRGALVYGFIHDQNTESNHTYNVDYRSWLRPISLDSTVGTHVFGADASTGQYWTAATPTTTRMKSIVLTPDMVLVAAMPDTGDTNRGQVECLSTVTGASLGTIATGAAPAFGGLAVAEGNLYMSTRRHSVVCLSAATSVTLDAARPQPGPAVAPAMAWSTQPASLASTPDVQRGAVAFQGPQPAAPTARRPSALDAAAPAVWQGRVIREYWAGLEGGSLSDLTGSPHWPDRPTAWDTLDRLETPRDWADNYGERIYGYITAPLTAAYTFYLSADEQAELYVSTSANPARKRRIAHVDSATAPGEWDRYPAQASAAVHLTQGRRYYFEVLHKEGAGSDHCAVAWECAGRERSTIPGDCLSAVRPRGPAAVEIAGMPAAR